jgi:teichoic acid transport system permease protein
VSEREPSGGRAEGEEPAVLGAAAPLSVEAARRTAPRARDGSGGPLAGDRRAAGPADEPRVREGEDGVEYVFGPSTRAMPDLRSYGRALWERRRFMTEMARADLRGARSSTVLGSLWSLLDPLFQAGIYYLVFTIIRSGSRPEDFLHVLIGGIFLFQLSIAGLTEGGTSVRQAKHLMLNSAFPRALLPLTTVYKGVLKIVPAIPVYAFFHLLLGAPTGWGLLLLPLIFALQVFFTAGIAMMAATAVVFFRDATNVLGYIARVLFFASPVIFPVDIIPESIRTWISWQPFFPLFASYQEIFGGGVPGPGMVLQIIAWSAFFFLVGGWLFLRHERDFAIRL